MKRLLFGILLLIAQAFASNGTFTGQVVNGPNLDRDEKWIYVQSAKGAVRRVEISAANVSYGPSVAKKDRAAKPEDGVHEGAEVRVTASQDGDGEWKASRIEILRSAPN